MTVTPEMIKLVSPYEVSEDGDFTYDDFLQYKTWAQSELDNVDPGLTTSMYDQAHALLICDIFEQSKGRSHLKSEKIGNYSYTTADNNGNGQKTAYRIRFENMLSTMSTETVTAGVDRIDMDADDEYGTDYNFRLDQEPPKGFEEEWEDI